MEGVSYLDRLGVPEPVLSVADAVAMGSLITMLELESGIKALDSSKAAGADGVTNSMIKHLPDAGNQRLLSIYNNALLSGCVPDDWRVGEVVLVLKKNPPTNIENYRPITLISCVSKLMTRILARRISSAVEFSSILGPE